MKIYKWLLCILAAAVLACCVANAVSYVKTNKIYDMSQTQELTEAGETKNSFISSADSAVGYAGILLPAASRTVEQRSEQIASIQPAQAEKGQPVWYVSYVNCRGADSAPADGSVGLYKDGWFVAHSHLWGGMMIASQPEYVVVDGITYQRAYSKIIGEHEYPGMEEEIHFQDGIMFQTCAGPENNLLVFYHPKK